MRLRAHVPSLLSIASQLTWGAQGFITFVLAGRLLPQREFGLVVVSNAILFGCQCLLLGPVTNPTLRFGAVSGRSLRMTYLMYCAVTAIVCLVFLLGSNQIGRLIGNDVEFVALVKYLTVPFATTSLYAVQKIVLFARMRYKTVLVIDVLFMVSNVTALLLLHHSALLTSATSFYMVRSGAALVGLVPVLALYLFSSDSTAEQDSDPFDRREYFRHSKYSTISMFSSYGQGQVDALAVAHFLSPLGAAAYGAAKVFYTGMTMITTGLIMVVLPTSSRMCASGNGGLPSYYRKALLLGYAFLLPGAVVLTVFAHRLLHLCFAGRYDGAVPLVRIFCIASLILPVSSISDAVANGAGWFRSACVAAVSGGVVGTIMSIGLTRAFGVSGAALAPILSLCVSGSVINVLIWKRLSASTARGTTELRDVAVAAGD